MQAGLARSDKQSSIWSQIRIFSEKISADEVFTYSASLAYFTALAIAPLVVLIISFMALMNFDLQAQFLQQAQSLMGHEASKVLESILNSANNRPDLSVAAGWTGAIVLAISASVVFAHLQSALNRIFVVERAGPADRTGFVGTIKGLVLKRLLSVGILLSFIFISIISLTVSAALSYLMDRYDIVGIQFLSGVLNFAAYTFLFSLIYKLMPDCHVELKSSLIAGALTAVLFGLGKALIGTYLGQTALGSAYGAAGSLIVLLAWIYYSSLVFFLGAEVSSLFVFRKRST